MYNVIHMDDAIEAQHKAMESIAKWKNAAKVAGKKKRIQRFLHLLIRFLYANDRC